MVFDSFPGRAGQTSADDSPFVGCQAEVTPFGFEYRVFYVLGH